MTFQYITSIILWSLYTIIPSGILWYINYDPHILDSVALSNWEVHYFLLVFALGTGLGIYKVIERSRNFKNYLTTKNQ